MDRNRLISDKFGLIRSWVCPACKLKKANARSSSFSTVRRRSTLNAQASPPIFQSQNVSYQNTARRQLSNTSRLRSIEPRQPILPNGPARTRFAPSPTGYLHIGGLRTALFSYLLAKRTGGQFLLRIEDTDQKRLVLDAERALCDNIRWAGLEWDEGPEVGGPYGPYRQSERTQIYQEHSRILLDQGSAYRCFCTPQSNDSAKVAYVTSGCYQSCSSLSSEESQSRAEDKKEAFTVRLRPMKSKGIYKDLVYGKIKRLKRSTGALQDDSVADASDTILMKSEGTPTYHFAHVVDDHLMKITHVIRGSEWMASTPLHYDLYSAFGWEPPQFAHVGLLVDANEAKLSKRNREAARLSGQDQDLASDVGDMRTKHGILPETLNNFLALLGWSNPTDNDVMDMNALIRNFDLKFTRGNAMVRKEKLQFLQKSHVALLCEKARESQSFEPIKDLVSQVAAQVHREFSDPIMNTELFSEVYYSDSHENPDPVAAYCTEVLLADSKSYWNAVQFVERNRYFFAFDTSLAPKQESHDKINPVNQAAKFVVESVNEARAVEDPNNLRSVQDQDRVFHKTLWCATWSSAFVDFQAVKSEDFPSMGAGSALNPSTRVQVFDDRLDARSQAKALLEDLKPESSVCGEDVDTLVSLYKSTNKSLMKYLRERLAYGQPGPSMSTVMALLGPDECCRRLEVETSHAEGAKILLES